MIGPAGYDASVDLTAEARQALATALSTGRDHRVVMYEHCHTGRWRLAVRYVRVDDRGESPIDLGLIWSEDLAGLEELRGCVEREIAQARVEPGPVR